MFKKRDARSCWPCGYQLLEGSDGAGAVASCGDGGCDVLQAGRVNRSRSGGCSLGLAQVPVGMGRASGHMPLVEFAG